MISLLSSSSALASSAPLTAGPSVPVVCIQRTIARCSRIGSEQQIPVPERFADSRSAPRSFSQLGRFGTNLDKQQGKRTVGGSPSIVIYQWVAHCRRYGDEEDGDELADCNRKVYRGVTLSEQDV